MMMNEKPEPGQSWETERGSMVRIYPSSNPAIIEAAWLDIKAGGHIPVQFDLDGRKMNGWADRLTKRAILY